MAARTRITALACCVVVCAAIDACDSAGTSSAMAGSQASDDEAALKVEFADVRIKGEKFHLELALDDQKRFRGLSERESIPENGGMLFVFPDVQLRAFVMRDCPNPIDIAFLDGSGRVVAVHTMAPEPPRGANESSMVYEQRLPGYSSRYGAQFAIETAGGRLQGLELKPGDQIEFDMDALKARAR